MTEETQPQGEFNIIAQYTKDFSFENVTPAATIAQAKEQPNIDVQLKVNAEKSADGKSYIVSLVTNIQTKLGATTLFVLDLTYAGEFVINGFEQSMLDIILYIECPRILFPFVRNIIATAVNEGGFPPLYLSPVNFAELYQQQLEAKNQTKQ
ncbi:MAG: protein-export chaperone SecB [Alphaproteobacteria bacterium]|nr:protein-export chaperone SecB [Alphaproteobacteria bacterium]